jgi:hypothetical protein
MFKASFQNASKENRKGENHRLPYEKRLSGATKKICASAILAILGGPPRVRAGGFPSFYL